MGIPHATAGDVLRDGQDDGTGGTGDGRRAVHHRSDGTPRGLRSSVDGPECPATAVPVGGTGGRDAGPGSGRPVFVDVTGRRGRTWRRAGTVTALCCACYATTVGIALVGGDAGAPFLELPRAMGLERGGSEKPAASEGEAPAAPAGKPAPPAHAPTPRARVHPSAVGPSAEPLRVEASSGPADIRVSDARPAVPPAGARPSDGGTQAGAGDGEPASTPPSSASGAGGAPEAGGTPAGSGDGAPEPEGDGAGSSSGGPVGDFLAGLLGGLLGRR
ncbi:hypothetical protein [Streptomyces sp. NPDC086010]|uniref:hypothetical protein n=1 Tax=Streptomyces sp. NPDC086010 TaxID=3365745 RepID=UPI0037D3FFC7